MKNKGEDEDGLEKTTVVKGIWLFYRAGHIDQWTLWRSSEAAHICCMYSKGSIMEQRWEQGLLSEMMCEKSTVAKNKAVFPANPL